MINHQPDINDSIAVFLVAKESPYRADRDLTSDGNVIVTVAYLSSFILMEEDEEEVPTSRCELLAYNGIGVLLRPLDSDSEERQVEFSPWSSMAFIK